LNRALRLWPTYILLLLLTWLTYAALHRPATGDDFIFELFRDLDRTGFDRLNSLMTILTVFLFGQDIASVRESLQFMLPVRQSWSIASELLFYLAVPLIFRVRAGIWYFVGFATLIVLKCTLTTWGDWRASYFLPFGNFGYFLLGIGLYFLIEQPAFQPFRLQNRVARAALLVALIACFCLFGEASLERGGVLKHLALIAIFSIAVTMLFKEAANRFDLFLGNISYGIYLNHFLILVVGRFLHFQGVGLLAFTIAGSVLLSYVSELLIQSPIDRMRRKSTAMKPKKIQAMHMEPL